MNSNTPGPLVTQRTALVLLLGAVSATAAATLTHLAETSWPLSVLAGLGAFTSSVATAHRLIG
ncbi:hypothetical protein ACWCYY_16185 [Kitasatospora sp. NPDC001664]